MLAASNVFGACAPANGTEWIKSSTTVAVYCSDSSGEDVNTRCNSDWGATVTAQVARGGGLQTGGTADGGHSQQLKGR